MTRVSLYALIPYVLTAISFGTAYFDAYILAVILISVIQFIRRKRIVMSLFMLIFTTIAFFTCGSSYSLCNKSFYPLLDEPISLTCMVDETPSYSENTVQFTAKMISAVHHGGNVKLDEKVLVFINGVDLNLHYGDEIEFKTTLTLPNENSNIGGFNYRNHLRSQDIHTLCTTYDYAVANRGTHEKINPVIHKIFILRSALLQKCDKYFSGDISAFIKALILGYKSDMSDELNVYINRAGISHIVSISGLHLSIMMVMINLILQKLKFRSSVFVIPILNIISALFITVLTGFSPSVMRAALMLIISNSAALVYRENDSVQSMSFAMLILLLANPCAIDDVRLVLSAVSTLGIILFYEKVNKKSGFIKPKFIRDTLSMTLSAQIAAVPFCVFYFGTISVLGILTNLIIVPLMPSLMGTCLIFMAMPFFAVAQFLSDGIWLAIKCILIVAKLISLIPFAQLDMGFAKFTYTTLLTVFIVYMMKKTITRRDFRKNLLCFALSCIAVMLIFFSPATGNFNLTVINVGQGDCTLIEFPNGKTMLIDGGGSATSDYDTAAKIIKPYLIQNGINKIDYAVISHFHADHAGGILNLAACFPVDCIIAPDYLKAGSESIIQNTFDICKRRQIPLYLMEKGDGFSPAEGITFKVYSPESNYIYGENDGSMVFKISAFGRSVLFTGDIERHTRHILANSSDDISCDILKAPHHGDYSTADSEFLDAASAEIVYVCVGKNNSYGHPDEKSLMLYADKKINTFRTDIDQTIKFTIKRNGEIKIS